MHISLEEQQTADKNLITYQRISVKGKGTLEINIKYTGRRKMYVKLKKGHISAVTLAFSFISWALFCIEHVVRLY